MLKYMLIGLDELNNLSTEVEGNHLALLQVIYKVSIKPPKHIFNSPVSSHICRRTECNF